MSGSPNRPLSRTHRLLVEGSRAMGFSLNAIQTEQFLLYLGELQRWAQRINLTALKEDEEIIEKHFLDSLGGLPEIRAGEGSSILDIGSGAGFPGMALKIARPELSMILLEPSGKRAAFLHHLCGHLEIGGVEIWNRRLNQLGDSDRELDYCVSRATGPVEKLLEECRPLLGPAGRALLYEGRPKEKTAQKIPGWSRKTRIYRLPFSHIEREIGVYSKEKGL